MGRRRKNTFAKALGQLKSTKIDEKIQMLSERPTNSVMTYMTTTPSTLNPDFVSSQRGQDSALSVVEPDFAQDDASENGRDTTGLFKEDGTPRVAMPPGDTSYILGPMAGMFYNYSSPWTRIGYIRQSDRKMVNLGSIVGKLSDWDGSSNFTTYGQLTLAQAQWFKDVQKAPGQSNDPDTYNYRAFYPGPPSSSPDAFGRYYCVITGQPLSDPLDKVGEKEQIPGQSGEATADDIFSAIMDRINKGKKLSKAEEEWLEQQGLDDFYKGGDTQSPLGNLALLGATAALVKGAMAVGIAGLGKILGFGKHAGATLGAQKAGEFLGQQIVDFGSPVVSTDSAFNKQLAVNLLTSILTGKTNNIKISQGLSNTAIQNVNLKNLENNITIGTAPDYNSAEYNVNPKNKSQIFTKELSAQGGSMVNYDPKTDTLTIVSPKTLRTNQEGDKFDISQGGQVSGDTVVDKGKQIHFADIPSPSQESVESKVKGLLGKSYVDFAYSGLSGATTGQITGGDGKTYSNAWDMIKNDSSKDADGNTKMDNFVKGAAEQSNKLATGAIQKVAVEAVALRKALIKLGISKSETEQTGDAYGHVMSQSTYTGSQIPAEIKAIINKKNTKNESYLSESRKTSILKNLKNPVVIPETKQKSYKVKPKIRGLNSAIISKPVETPKEYQPKGGRNLWGQFEYDRNVRQSQERKNEVLELVGEGEHAFNYMLTDSRAMNAQQLEKFWGLHPELYSYFYNGKKFKATRKEALDGDFLVFLVDENGEKSNILQSELNEKLAEEDDRKALEEYNKLNPKSKEPISFEKDYMFKKAYQKLKKEVDYKDKPAKMGYPNDPPPKMVNDRHPDFGKRPGTTMFNKLDPSTAAATPKQDDPTIDAKVEKAKNNPDKDGSNWRKELEVKIKKHRQSIK